MSESPIIYRFDNSLIKLCRGKNEIDPSTIPSKHIRASWVNSFIAITQMVYSYLLMKYQSDTLRLTACNYTRCN